VQQQHLYSASTIRSLARARHARCRMPVVPKRALRCTLRAARATALGCGRPPVRCQFSCRCDVYRCERRVRTRRAGRRPTRRSTTCTVGAALQRVRRAALQLAALQHAALQHAACRVRCNLSRPSGAPHRALQLRSDRCVHGPTQRRARLEPIATCSDAEGRAAQVWSKSWRTAPTDTSRSLSPAAAPTSRQS
jgi:hypothetical protein